MGTQLRKPTKTNEEIKPEGAHGQVPFSSREQHYAVPFLFDDAYQYGTVTNIYKILDFQPTQQVLSARCTVLTRDLWIDLELTINFATSTTSIQQKLI